MNKVKGLIRKIKYILQSVDYRHYICCGITLLCVLAWGMFPNAFIRLLQSLVDFGTSCAYGVSRILHGESIIPATVTHLPFYNNTASAPTTTVPAEWSQFKVEWVTYWRNWASWRNFGLYSLYVLFYLLIALHVLFVVFVVLFVLRKWVSRRLRKQRPVAFDEHGKAINANVDSKPLKVYRRISFVVRKPFQWLGAFIGFVRENPIWWKVWLGMWLFYFNFITIAFEFVAYLIYLLVSFEFSGLYRQVYKLCLDLSALFGFMTFGAWVVVFAFFFVKWAKETADGKLQHFINYDRGFSSERSLFTIICATVGAGKTTQLVHMGLLDRLNHRDRAFADMLKNDLKFPNFPWINLEKSLLRAMENGAVKDLRTVRLFVKQREIYFKKYPIRRNCFSYDFKHYGLYYNDGLKVSTLFDVLSSYAQQYFIYIANTSILANFGIRLDDFKEDLGHFPIWNSDFLQRDPRYMDAYSRHCKILDFNALRIGVKMVSDNDFVYNFEFGTILITEIGKEFMNDKELRDLGVKFVSLEANQKNDGTINEIKLIRHAATVDGFPYVVIRADEQRPESLGANIRDMFEIIHIRERGERQIAFPFFSCIDLLYASVFNKFAQVYYQYRFIRSDNTLCMHLLKGFVSRVEHFYTRMYNRYGYRVVTGELERGTQDGVLKKFKYFLIDKLIYAKTFATDCYQGYFDERLAECTVGLAGVPEYETEKASFAEMQKQNSYMVRNLLSGIANSKNQDK